MCTLLMAYKFHPDYDFIFLGNRDEYKDRPARAAHFWPSYPNLLAGIDLVKGGTWTGITREGRLAFVTNYRDFSLPRSSTLSRGALTRDFLIKSIPPLAYLQNVHVQRSAYDPFNLIVGTPHELYYYSNMENQIRLLQPGVYGLSNALLDTPWFKVTKAKERLICLLATDFSVQQLFDILADREVTPDEQLPRTGLTLEKERALSSIYVDISNYGTQFQTVILIRTGGEVQFYEKSSVGEDKWQQSSFFFNLQ
ncbi:hypothetical protein SPSYN_00441 [Sporotomaculum syntrophicum]|uniref:NRDE family protein n=1 Tax=Sporotomaculum syntrophicum TaxID=182264 RepID=A0A9D2WU83_9FIRM|nr:NRDE family protein [Sporotomaculum syntrophicum]KAF1086722.1 hypothetical protein SPSYN_00441 [Sporotomaculum syntrophicum]